MSVYLRWFHSILLIAFLSACGGGGDDENGGDGGGGPNPAPLGAPSNVQASGFENGINITWDPVSGVGSYRIYYSTSSPVTKQDSFFSGVGTGHNHTDLNEGDTFFYAISAIQSSEESDLSSEVNATALGVPEPPEAVSQLYMRASDGSVTVNWAGVSDATSYNLYHANGSSVSTSDTQVLNVTSPYTLSGLTNGTQITVMVAAVNDDGETAGTSATDIPDVRLDVKHHAPRLTAAAFGNSTHVLVGDGGAIYTAQSDGSSLTAQTSGTTLNINSVVFGANKFVAMAASGIILTSENNGVTWSQGFSPSGGQMDKVIFANNLFIGIGQFSMITSSDGDNWTLRDHSSAMCNEEVSNDNYLAYAAYGSNKLLTSGSTGCIKTSTDNGVTWAANSVTLSETEELLNLIHDGSKFVAITRDNGPTFNLLTSADGDTWTRAQISDSDIETIQGLSFGESRYVTSTNGGNGLKYLYSTDGLDWIEGAQTNNPDIGFTDVFYNGTDFVAVGGNLQLVMSEDGSSWDNKTADVITADFFKILHDGSQYIALASEGSIYTSTNLTSWTLQNTFALSNGRLTDAHLNGSVLTVAGYTGFFGNSSGSFYSATDLSGMDPFNNWAASDVAAGGINDIVYDGIRYVAATRATIAFPAGNPQWDQIANQPAFVPYVAIESDETNIVAMISDRIYTQTVAGIADWNGVAVATGSQLTSGSYSQLYKQGSNFYAFSTESGILQSTDGGGTWTNINSDPLSNGVIGYDGDSYMVVGGESGFVDTTNFVLEQVRGGKRTENETPFTIQGIYWTGSEYVLVGSDGFVATHPGF